MGKELFTVARIFGAYYELYSSKWKYQRATLKGKLRLGDTKERHPLAVGDYVHALPIDNGSAWIVQERLDRKNFLIRKSEDGDGHVLASNLDQVAILISLRDPETKTGFVDRVLATVFQAKIEPLLVFTKKDLVTDSEWKEKVRIYLELGYRTLAVSLQDPKSIEEFQKLIQGKVTFFAGNSGVGKSSLLNSISAQSMQKVTEVSSTTKKGKHTTTNSFALILSENTTAIDSPGVKEWGILHLNPQEIQDSFPEFQKGLELSNSRKKSFEAMLESLQNPRRTTRRDHWKGAGVIRKK